MPRGFIVTELLVARGIVSVVAAILLPILFAAPTSR